MAATNPTQQNVLFYKLKIDKATETPYFFRKEKKGDAWVETDKFAEMAGYIEKIEIREYTYEGQTKESIVISMKDDVSDDRMVVTTSFNNMTRGVINNLAGCDSIGLVTLTARRWAKKGADKAYPTVFVLNNGQKTAWRYQINEMPSVEKITNKKGEVVSFDDSDLNAFFKQVINTEIIPKLTSPKEVKNEMESHNKVSQETANSNTWQAPDEISDLPF